MIKQLKFATTVLIATLVGFLQIYATDGAQNQPARLFEIAGMNVPFEQRVGVDDGAALIVHFSGDTKGSLDVCG